MNLTFATLNSNFLKTNFLNIKKILKNNKIWIVVKSNAYGHGIINIIKIIKNADGFAVSNLEEAMLIRKYNWNGPILILEGFYKKNEIYLILKNNFTTVVHNKFQINLIKNYIFKNNEFLNIYVKFNSNINRLGFNIKDIKNIIYIINNLKNIKILSIMTHFSDYINNNIKNKIKFLYKIYIYFNKKYHLCIYNSIFIFFYKYINYEHWLRIGILIYGLYPSKDNYKLIYKKIKVKQIISLYSTIISIRKVKKNSIIGYGNSFVSKKNMKIGIVSCGYSNGYPVNNICNNIPVFVKNKKSIIIGKICMNLLFIDLTNVNNIKIGDIVELWGNNIKINHLSKIFNISPHRIVSMLSNKILINII